MSIGEALAQARYRAGLTVAQVGQQTGIRETIITAIEDDDYSACGGDVYARGYIRSIARAVGANAEQLIREYSMGQPGQQAISDETAAPGQQAISDETAAASVTPIRMQQRHRLYWRAALGVALGVGAGFAAYHFVAFSPPAAGTSPPARSHQVTPSYADAGRQAAPAAAAPAIKPATPGAVPARTLIPASAAAFGPHGAGQGDNSYLAPRAIDADPATAWHSDWYATARLGNLYPGTGLLVDMGRPVTITAARITLGSAHGAGFQLRVGAAPTLADLPPVAHAASAGGVVRLRLTTPARGRYVLIWFTRLPPDPAGTFRASVYSLRLEGRA